MGTWGRGCGKIILGPVWILAIEFIV